MVQISNGPDSKQDYETPRDFIIAVENKFNTTITFDLAASWHNAKAGNYFTIEDDSLKQDWSKLKGALWLNPPYRNIRPWAQKCAETKFPYYNRRIFFLVPASVGSNWFRDYVMDKADIYFLNGRLSFDGKNVFPKDLMLCVYRKLDWWSPDGHPVMEVWRWKDDISGLGNRRVNQQEQDDNSLRHGAAQLTLTRRASG